MMAEFNVLCLQEVSARVHKLIFVVKEAERIECNKRGGGSVIGWMCTQVGKLTTFFVDSVLWAARSISLWVLERTPFLEFD